MLFKTRIACYGNRDIALDVARETIIEAGFEAVSGPKDDVQEFVNPHTWNLAAQSPLLLSDRISVRSAPDSLVLEGNLAGVVRRSTVMAYGLGAVALMLIIANFMWSVHTLSLAKVMLPIAPWPLLIPLIHKNLNWLAQRKWNTTLRLIGRTAALRAAEQIIVEEPETESSNVKPRADTKVAEVEEAEAEVLLV